MTEWQARPIPQPASLSSHSAPQPAPQPAPRSPDLLEPADRLRFEAGRLRFRAALLLGPVLLVLAYGRPALPVVVLSALVVACSTGAIWILQRRAPHLLLRFQLPLRLLDVGLILLVLHNTGLLAVRSDVRFIEYFDALYLLPVVAATATHGRRGAYVVSAAATLAVLANRQLLAATEGRPLDAVQLFAAVFYAALFAISGSTVAFLMHTSGAVVARRDDAWRTEMAAQNRRLEHAATQLAAANKELEAFAYSVSHDLRAPLRSIDGFSRVVADKYADRLDTQGQDYLRRIRAASQRMGQLIDDLLNLSRLTRATLSREPVDLSALARSVAQSLQEASPDRKATFVIQSHLGANGDSRLLRIVLDNLLGNAWKFTAKKPSARIEFGQVTADDHETAFYVRDDGAGFDLAYAGKLFGAFQRLHAAGEFEGTGIGLATVQRIIHRHGGRVWASAAPDQGATFFFTL